MKKIGHYFKSIPGRIIVVIMLQWVFFFVVFISYFYSIILVLSIKNIQFEFVITMIDISNIYAWRTVGVIWGIEIIMALIGKGGGL